MQRLPTLAGSADNCELHIGLVVVVVVDVVADAVDFVPFDIGWVTVAAPR